MSDKHVVMITAQGLGTLLPNFSDDGDIVIGTSKSIQGSDFFTASGPATTSDGRHHLAPGTARRW